MTKKIGRPPVKANLAIVAAAAARGLSQSDAARSLGISLSTFKNKLRDDPVFASAWIEERERAKAEAQAAISAMPAGRSNVMPLVKPKVGHRPIQVNMTRELSRRVQLAADARGCSRNLVIVEAVERYLAQAEALPEAA